MTVYSFEVDDMIIIIIFSWAGYLHNCHVLVMYMNHMQTLSSHTENDLLGNILTGLMTHVSLIQISKSQQHPSICDLSQLKCTTL